MVSPRLEALRIMMSWRSMMGGRVLTDLWHISGAFYIRTKDPTEDDDMPPVIIGSTAKLSWDRGGSTNVGDPVGGRIRGDLALILPPKEDGEDQLPPRMRMAIYDAAVGVQRREFYNSTAPRDKGFVFPSDAEQVHVATDASVYTKSGKGYFHQREDGSITEFTDDPLPLPPGFRTWEYNQKAFALANRADLGPIAYGRSIATTSLALYGPPLAPSEAGDDIAEPKPERAYILGYTGKAGQPGPLGIDGPEVKGHVTSSKPVGHIGQDHVVWQQAAIELVENPNPEEGYVADNGYMKVTAENGSVSYKRIPVNYFANWGSQPLYRYLWSTRVYRVDIVEGESDVDSTRTLIAQSVNTWETVPGTGGEEIAYDQQPSPNGPIYVPTQRKIGEQFVPKIDDDEEPEMGYTLTAVMERRDGSPYESRLPFDYEAPNPQFVIDFDVPGSLIEINPTLWLAATRYSFLGIDMRWMYSRDEGVSWHLIDANFTNINAGGASAVQMNVFLADPAYNAAIKREQPLVPATQ